MNMSDNPWQQIDCKHVLFIVDAGHKVEETLLLDWVNANQVNDTRDKVVNYCVVPIANDLENIPTDQLERALQVPPETLLVPLRVVWKTNLDKPNNKPRLSDLLRGNPRRPSQKKAKRILNNDPSRALCIMGKPADLADLTERYTTRQRFVQIDGSLAEYVAGQAGLALEVAERRLRGSRYKIPRQVAKQVRASDAYYHGLLEIAAQSGDTEQRLRTRALPYFKELVATPHNFWQDVAGAFNRWMISLGYNNEVVFDQQRLQRFHSIVREHPTALLWTHKTHMDGVTMQSVLFEHDFPTPHTMGGINMAFAGVGYLARRSGAIFIRRSFQDNALYKLVLRLYLAYLLEKRFPLTWAFEGTRSRVGKLMPPRYGMLKYVLDAMQQSSAENLHIIPVAINYDMINDVKDYAAEQSGGIKRPESLSWLISYLRRMRQPLGRIYLDFGEPVVVNKAAIGDDRLALQKIAFQVGVEANRVSPITVTALLSMSLLGAAPRAQTIAELRDNMDSLRVWAKRRAVKFTDDFDIENAQRLNKLLDAMIESKLINRYDEGPETVYAVAADQHAMASYYRNTIIHHFISKAIAELALAKIAAGGQRTVDAFWAEADRLKDMFKFEFFYEPTEEFHQQVRSELNAVDEHWEQHLGEQKIGEQNTAVDLLRKMQPLVAHAVLKPYVEAYRIVADVFARLGDNETLEQKAATAAAFKYGRQAYLQRRISSKASIGTILFANGYKLLDSYNLVSLDKDPQLGSNLVERRKQISKELRLLSHRLEQIRTLAMPSEFDY